MTEQNSSSFEPQQPQSYDSAYDQTQIAQPNYGQQQSQPSANQYPNYNTNPDYGYNNGYSNYNNPAMYAQPQQQAVALPDHPQSTTVMIMGILGIFSGLIFSIIGWIIGNNALKSPDASHYNTNSLRTWTKVSKIFTIIHAILIVLVILFYIIFIVIMVGVSGSSSTY